MQFSYTDIQKHDISKLWEHETIKKLDKTDSNVICAYKRNTILLKPFSLPASLNIVKHYMCLTSNVLKHELSLLFSFHWQITFLTKHMQNTLQGCLDRLLLQ